MTQSNNSGTINHDGIVQKRDENTVTVSISSVAACAGCHAEGSCTMSDKQEKIIEVHGNYNVKPGDKVTVRMQQSMGYIALFLGYILPGITVIALLITLISVKLPELTSGLISIGILIPYYSVLFFFRERIDKKFTFTLKV
jgi:positive regulator of sigma E activity